MSDDYTVAVIGAGASGVISAVALARTTRAEVVLIDPCEPGPGVPYRTTDERHRLNVPAGWMSALDDEPDDLVDWCNSVGHQVAADDYLASWLTAITSTPCCAGSAPATGFAGCAPVSTPARCRATGLRSA